MEHSLTKKDLVLHLSKALKLEQKQARAALQIVLNNILEALLAGNNVELRNFGVFEVQIRKSRIGRNPNNPKKDIIIPDRAVIKFKVGKHLKKQLGELDLKSLQKKHKK